jgi:hypothetical protein
VSTESTSTTETGTETSEGTEQTATTEATTTETTTTDGGKATETKVKIEGEFDAARAARALENARNGEKTAKQQLAAVAKALGLDTGEKPDPEALAKQLTAAQDTARTTQVELATYRRAAKAGADPDALLDSRSFLDSVRELDPASATFGDDVEAAIKKAIKENARLKAGSTGAPAAGVPLNGAPDTTKKKATSLEDAVSQALA